MYTKHHYYRHLETCEPAGFGQYHNNAGFICVYQSELQNVVVIEYKPNPLRMVFR